MQGRDATERTIKDFFETIANRSIPRRTFGSWPYGIGNAQRAYRAIQDAFGPDPSTNAHDTAARLIALVLNDSKEEALDEKVSK